MNEYDVPFHNGTMHEFVISAEKQKKKNLKALDIAKNLLDYGIHPPTVYFPTNIPESIMIEPTETETKETLDEFAEIMKYINNNIDNKLDYFGKWTSNIMQLKNNFCNAEPFLTSDELLRSTLQKAIEKVVKLNPQNSTSGGTSDARFITKL